MQCIRNFNVRVVVLIGCCHQPLEHLPAWVPRSIEQFGSALTIILAGAHLGVRVGCHVEILGLAQSVGRLRHHAQTR